MLVTDTSVSALPLFS